MPAKHKFTEDDIKKILKMYQIDRMKILQISKEFKVSWGAIKREIVRHIEIYDPLNNWTKEEVEELIILRNEGLSRFKISKIIGKSVNQIKSRVAILKLERARVKLPTRNPFMKCDNDFERHLRLRFSNIRSRCIRLEKEFTITIDEFLNQWANQNGKCYYTGLNLNYKPKLDNSFSVDRIDSSMGYTKENTVFCITWVNSMKSDATIIEFVEMCRLIVNHSDSLIGKNQDKIESGPSSVSI